MKTQQRLGAQKLLPISIKNFNTPKNQIHKNKTSHFRLKSQGTIDTAITRKQFTTLPQIQIHPNLNKNILHPHRQLRPIRLIRPHTQLSQKILHLQKDKTPQKQQSTQYSGLTIMNDDFKLRKNAYRQYFAMSRTKYIQLQISFTQKFCYITLHQIKADIYYKLRLLKQTGKTILDRFTTYKLKFKDYICRDQLKRYILNAPFPPFSRKFKFINIEPSIIKQQQFEDQDIYLRKQISGIDRTQSIFQHFADEKKKKYRNKDI